MMANVTRTRVSHLNKMPLRAVRVAHTAENHSKDWIGICSLFCDERKAHRPFFGIHFQTFSTLLKSNEFGTKNCGKPGMVMHVCTPSTWESETGGLIV
jgi:hypothetical protein